MKIKRIVLSGGGTGGHIYPATSIYQALKAQQPDLEALYIGTPQGLERDIVPRMGIPFETVQIQGIKRELSLDNLRSLWLMATSTRQASQMIKDYQPDVVVGTGGYVCAPVLLAAARLGIPTLIHEQNSVAGLTNKMLSRYVDRIAISFEAVAPDFDKYRDKLVLTGNPRGQEVVQAPLDEGVLADQFNLDPAKQTVLIFGGSRGAPAINQAAVEAIPLLADLDYQVIISTGTIHYDSLKDQAGDLPDNVRLVPYIDNMPSVFNHVDLVVSRSGATTLTELTALGIASILIPSPYVTNDHQTANALALVNKGAARMIRETELNPGLLVEEINSLLFNPSQVKQMNQAAKSMGITNATDLIIEELVDLVDNR